MQDDEDAGRSFIKHMQGNWEGLQVYANLIWAGLAQVPVSKPKAANFKRDLLPWVSRCKRCGQPVGANNCVDCEALYEAVCLQTATNLAKYRKWGFCCLELEGLPYRKPWQHMYEEGK